MAVAAFLALNWTEFTSSSADNSRALILYDFPAMGRLPIVSRMVTEFSLEAQPILGNLLVAALALAGVAWGVAFARNLPGNPVQPAMLGSAGSTVFLASVLVAGFGFAYKAAFLLLLLPLMSLPRRPRQHFLLYTSLVTMLLVSIPLIVGYSILLTSLAGILAASIGLRRLAVRARPVPEATGPLSHHCCPASAGYFDSRVLTLSSPMTLLPSSRRITGRSRTESGMADR